jgi:hypothetical protein
MGWWRAFHGQAWWVRWSGKSGILALTILLVAYPYPTRLVTHMRRWQNPAALINPDSPALTPLIDDLRDRIRADLPARKKLRIVEAYVYEKLPYAWDWDTWGVADYIPTVEEALEQGQEDCDGRAVVAASILSAFGHKAEIVSDYAHVWVKTEAGETMSPGKRKSIVASDTGVRVHWRNLSDLFRATLFGWAAFPLHRELIVLVVLWLLIMAPGTSWRWHALIALLLVDALLRLRVAGRDAHNPIVWLQGLALFEAGVALFLGRIAARRARSHFPAAPRVETPA